MSGVNFNDIENRVQKLTEESQALLQKIKCISKTQFNEEVVKNVRDELRDILKKVIIYYKYKYEEANDSKSMGVWESVMFEFDMVFYRLIEELKHINKIKARLDVFNAVQNIKQRLYSISYYDTCTDFVKKLLNDAQELIKKLQERRYFAIAADYCHDLLYVLETIKAYVKNTKIQVALECVSGVVTLGGSVAAGVAGGINIVAKNGARAASTTASATCGAAKGASSAASIAARASIPALGLTVSNSMSRGVVQYISIAKAFTQVASQISEAASQTAKVLTTVGQATNSVSSAINVSINYANSAHSIETLQADADLKKDKFTADNELKAEHFNVLTNFDKMNEIAEKMLTQLLNEEDTDENHHDVVVR